MTDYVVPPAATECPNCGAEKRSLAQHWRKSASCDFPEIPDTAHDVLIGILLGDGSVGGRRATNVEVQSSRRVHLEWIHGLLGPLSRGITRDNGGVYRLRTSSHPDLNRYRRWYGSGQKRVPDGVEATGITLPVWLACDSTISFGSGEDAVLSLSAVDDGLRGDKRKLLEDVVDTGTVSEYDRRIRLDADATQEALAAAGDPAPGSVYKWCLQRDVYEAAKRRVDDGGCVIEPGDELAERYGALLRLVADALSVGREEFSQNLFSGALAAPQPSTVSETLSGGSWEDALRVAGVQTRRSRPSSRQPSITDNRGGSEPVYTEDELLDAVRSAASSVGEPISINEYRDWREEGDPSFGALRNQIGNWSEVCERAGVETAKREVANEDVIESLQSAAAELGSPLTVTEYRDWSEHKRNAPSVAYLYRHYDSWEEACIQAGIGEPTKAAGGRGYKYDRGDVIAALRDAAAEHGEPLTSSEYAEWAAGREGRPSPPVVYGSDQSARYGSWADACADADVESP